MAGSRDLAPSTIPFYRVFFKNQFRAHPQYPAPGTSLEGKTAIVTGSNTGLGYEAARQLLDLGLSRLIMAVRSPAKGKAAAAELGRPHPSATIDVWQLDMASYDSVQKFAQKVDSDLDRVDFVLLNAGMMSMSFSKVESTGHEEMLQVNYISTMLLTLLLLPILKKKKQEGQAPPHLTIVNAALSLVAAFPNRDKVPLLPSFDTDQGTAFLHEIYNSSKLMAHSFLWQLVDYVSADDVIVNLADPAWVRGTDLAREGGLAIRALAKGFGILTGRSKKVGASCFVDALVNKGKESHGCFIMSWQIHP